MRRGPFQPATDARAPHPSQLHREGCPTRRVTARGEWKGDLLAFHTQSRDILKLNAHRMCEIEHHREQAPCTLNTYREGGRRTCSLNQSSFTHIGAIAMDRSTRSASPASQPLQTRKQRWNFWNTKGDTSANPLPFRSGPSIAGFWKARKLQESPRPSAEKPLVQVAPFQKGGFADCGKSVLLKCLIAPSAVGLWP